MVETITEYFLEQLPCPLPTPDCAGVSSLRQAQTRLTVAQTKELLAQYQQGVPVKELAAQFRIARQTVTEIYRRAGLEPRRRGLSFAQVRLAAKLYNDGASLATVGKKFNVNAETVRLALRAVGVQIRPRPGS